MLLEKARAGRQVREWEKGKTTHGAGIAPAHHIIATAGQGFALQQAPEPTGQVHAHVAAWNENAHSGKVWPGLAPSKTRNQLDLHAT